MRLAEITPKLSNARAVHERTLVRAPYAGRVVDLNVFAVGAVIGRGEKLMDIVPRTSHSVVEAKIAVEDITEVAPRALRKSGSRDTNNRPRRPYEATSFTYRPTG